MTTLEEGDDRIRIASADEARILAYLRSRRPDLEVPFLAHLDEGRRGILERLLQAVLRENIAGLAHRASWEDGGRTLVFGLSGGRTLRVPVVRRLSLGRLDFGPGLALVDGGDEEPITHPRRLLDLLRDEGLAEDERTLQFARELDNSAANYALALAVAGRRRGEGAEAARAAGASTTLEWVEWQLGRSPIFSPLVFFEHWVVDGHPLHPGAKIKLGMEVEDVLRYAPEAGATPEVALVAVARRSCGLATLGADGAAAILRREYPAQVEQASRHLEGLGLDPNDFELIPVHPWQLENTLPTLHDEALRRREVVPIPGVRIPTAALMSVRSLAPIGRRGEGKHHFKTALDVQMTNAVRAVTAQSAENGPMLSGILESVQRREGWFGGRLVVLREEVGVYYRPTDLGLSADRRATLSKHLAALIRENPEDHVGEGEIALPGSALIARSPVGDGPIVAELVERFAARRGLVDPAEAVIAFLRGYADVAVPGFLTLMSRYGIGLEGHLQNSIPVFREGEPVRMLVRDFGGVRILPPRMAAQGIEAHFLPGTAIVTDDVDDLRNKVYYAFFQNHLGELIAGLVRHYEVEESRLWRPIAEISREVFHALAGDPALADQARGDEAALFGSTLALKALTTMRLLGDVTRYSFVDVPNPLAEFEGPRR